MKLNDTIIGATLLSDFHIATLFCALVKLRGDLDAETSKDKTIMEYRGEEINAKKLIDAINFISDLITNENNVSTVVDVEKPDK
jgi:hypothetical protein